MALADNKTKIQALLAGINALPEAGSGEPAEPVLQEKSVTPSESAQTVKPDSGYDGLSQVSVGAISKTYVGSGVTKQAAKTITPSTSSQTAVASGVYTTGAVTVGAIPSTYVKPTATKAATTYTPSTSNQTIAAGTYCSGTQTIKGDANLVAGNIKSGVSIFGVAGTMTAGEDVTAETNTYTDLLTDLEAAVDALPDAGGGGASVETCTVTTRSGAPISGVTTIGYYVDGNGTVQPLTVSMSSQEFTVQKNSIISLKTWSAVSMSSGGIMQLYYANMQSAYFVTDDAVLDYAG